MMSKSAIIRNLGPRLDRRPRRRRGSCQCVAQVLDCSVTARHAADRCFAVGGSRLALVLHRTRLADNTLAAEEMRRLTRAKGLAKPVLIRMCLSLLGGERPASRRIIPRALRG